MNRRSLVLRSVVAILLLIGYYVLALGVAAFLLWTVYAQLALGHVIVKLALVCVVLAGIILWSVIPRPDRFEPPGPELTEAAHPRLFALIREISARTGQAMPSEVYLVPDVNAFVTQRGGFMGFFSRRVMGIGLPLLSLLSVAELSAVLAHEFGHFHGGDTKLGPWIYKTRGAIARTVVSLAQGGSTIVRKPFEWYGNFFLRITHSISRAQEYAADALAARVVGAAPLIRGLKTVHGGAAAYGAYLQQEFAPVVRAGFRPPLAEGFRTFVEGKRVKASLEKLVDTELAGAEHDPFDTHPPLAHRIEALAEFAEEAGETDDSPAIELLENPAAEEARLVRRDDDSQLEPLAWSKVATRVLLPNWQKTADRVVEVFGPLTLAELSKQAATRKFAEKVLKQDLSEVEDAAPRIGADLAASALCATLADAGWTVKNRVGRPIAMKNGEAKLTPFEDFAALAAGKLELGDLAERLAGANVAELVVHSTKPATTKE
ncbi:MAG TPA: M48 family metallopeptidase [Polyangiaceae bacterium]